MFYSYKVDGVIHKTRMILTDESLDDAIWVAKSSPTWLFRPKTHELSKDELETVFTHAFTQTGLSEAV